MALRRAVAYAQPNFMHDDKGSGAERMWEAAVIAARLIALAALVSAAMPVRVGMLVRRQDVAQPSASVRKALVKAKIHNKPSSSCDPDSLIRLFSRVCLRCALIASHAQRRLVKELIEEQHELMAAPAAAAAPVLVSLCLQLWAAALTLLYMCTTDRRITNSVSSRAATAALLDRALTAGGQNSVDRELLAIFAGSERGWLLAMAVVSHVCS